MTLFLFLLGSEDFNIISGLVTKSNTNNGGLQYTHQQQQQPHLYAAGGHPRGGGPAPPLPIQVRIFFRQITMRSSRFSTLTTFFSFLQPITHQQAVVAGSNPGPGGPPNPNQLTQSQLIGIGGSSWTGIRTRDAFLPVKLQCTALNSVL